MALDGQHELRIGPSTNRDADGNQCERIDKINNRPKDFFKGAQCGAHPEQGQAERTGNQKQHHQNELATRYHPLPLGLRTIGSMLDFRRI